MTINKNTANKATTPDDTATPVGKIIKNKVVKLEKQTTFENCPKCNRAYKKQDTLDIHVKTCQGKLQGTDGNGGARPGGGRPKGSENEKTKELKAIKSEMQNRIASKVNTLIAAQLRMAIGTHRLYMRELVNVGQLKRGKAAKGNELKTWKVSRVHDDADFMIYLSLDHDAQGNAKDTDTGIEYFYQVTGEGNHAALANLLDRAFGKPKENVELGEDPDAPLPIHGTGTTSELRKAMIEMVRAQVKGGVK